MTEATTLTELWRSPKWKALSRAYVEDKACEWCRAKVGDKYTYTKGLGKGEFEVVNRRYIHESNYL